MFEIKKSAFVVTYPPIRDLKKKYINNAELITAYHEADILSIDEHAPFEIPRIIMSSISGHSQITIAPAALSLNTTYDNNFAQSWDLCKDYLSDKFTMIAKFLESITEDIFSFSGITVLCWISDYDKPVQHLQDKFIALNTDQLLKDIKTRFSFVVNNKNYINLEVENSRFYAPDADAMQAGMAEKEQKHIISLTIDVNDRFAFNEDSNYKSSSNEFYENLDVISKAIVNAPTLINEGVWKW